jgi:lipoprotein-anchoring transpeptidase ErfK/SrfK
MMLRPALAIAAVLFAAAPAFAQGSWGWGGPYYNRSPYDQPSPRQYYPPPSRRYGYYSPYGWADPYDYPPAGPRFQSGGPRPAISPIPPQKIEFPSTFPVDSVIIDHKGRQLLLVISDKEAWRYPISVGREGFSWTGTETISRMAEWPDWHPPEEMRDRDPDLPERMSGGLRNPLGAKALYLGKSLYRIHGTNDARSIGKAASSGCFRMLNGHVVDLASRVKIGTTVTVVRNLPSELERAVNAQVAQLPPVASDRVAQPRDTAPPRRQIRRRLPPPRGYRFDPYWDDDY